MTKSESNTVAAADPSADLIPTEFQPDELPVYRVLSPVLHGTTATDQRRYEPGETIALSAAPAAPLLACGAIEAADA